MTVDYEKWLRSYSEGRFVFKTLEFFHPTMPTPIRIFHSATEADKNFRLESDATRDAGLSVAFSGASFDLNEPTQEKDANSVFSISLGIGSMIDVNEIVDRINLSTVGFLDPIEVIYRKYLDTETDTAPSTEKVLMFVNSIDMDVSSGVSVNATTTNNALYRTGTLYKIEDFPGLVTNA